MDPLTNTSILRLRPLHWRLMLEDVEARAPIEACGLLAGKEGAILKVYPISNALSSSVRFRMAAEEQLQSFLEIESLNMELLAIYHSHPGGPAEPSPTDLAEFFYPGVLYLIWYPGGSGWVCGCYKIEGNQFHPGRIELIPEE